MTISERAEDQWYLYHDILWEVRVWIMIYYETALCFGRPSKHCIYFCSAACHEATAWEYPTSADYILLSVCLSSSPGKCLGILLCRIESPRTKLHPAIHVSDQSIWIRKKEYATAFYINLSTVWNAHVAEIDSDLFVPTKVSSFTQIPTSAPERLTCKKPLRKLQATDKIRPLECIWLVWVHRFFSFILYSIYYYNRWRYIENLKYSAKFHIALCRIAFPKCNFIAWSTL